MPIGRLAQVLRGIHVESDPRLVVGPQTFDDAGVVRLEGMATSGPASALVQTVDFFPPVVDEPWYYGAIAAANSASDVYAMGGRPQSALCLAGFPKDFRSDWTEAIFQGGFETMRSAGAVVAGGHTVESAVQFGFAVTGLVDAERVTSNQGGRAGDRLYLTKPLGMGTLTTASKQGRLPWSAMLPAAQQMARLNAPAAEAMVAAGARAATDVTGYGLLGHARNLARGSQLCATLAASAIPLADGALGFAAEGVASGGSARNRESLAHEVHIGARVDPALATVCFDAETSGGLLIAVPPERARVLEQELTARDQPAVCIGELQGERPHAVELA